MIEFAPIGIDQAAGYLGDMVGNPKWDTSEGLCSILDIIGGGVPFLVKEGGAVLAVVVLDVIPYANGKELFVRVARQMEAVGDLTERVLPEIERRFGADCDALTLRTRRPGLVAKLTRAGYYETAKIMRKKLK